MPPALADRPNLLLITSDPQHWTAMGVRNPTIKTPANFRTASTIRTTPASGPA